MTSYPKHDIDKANTNLRKEELDSDGNTHERKSLSRRGARSTSGSVLPTYHRKDLHHDNSKKNSRERQRRRSSHSVAIPGSSPCSNFLLGGSYYPGKDKRRRIVRRTKQKSFCGRFCIMSFASFILFSWMIMFYYMHVHLNSHRMNVNPRHHKKHNFRTRKNELKEIKEDPIEIKGDHELVKDILTNIEYMKAERDANYNIENSNAKKSLISNAKLEKLRKIVPEWANMNIISGSTADDKKGSIEKSNYEDPSANEKYVEELEDSTHKTEIRRDSKKDHNLVSSGRNEQAHSASEVLNSENITKSNRHKKTMKEVEESVPLTQNDQNNVSISLLIQSTPDRLWLLGETCRRWNDPIILVVYNDTLSNGNGTQLERKYNWGKSCPQLTLIIVQPSHQNHEHDYPINRLRNIGLNAIKTSHFLVLDIDFVPSSTLQDIIHKYIMTSLTKDREALVVPAFEKVVSEPPCINDCSNFLNEYPMYIPSNFAELHDCVVEKKECDVFQLKNNWEGHSTTRSERWLNKHWYESDNVKEGSSSAQFNQQKPLSIPCFHTPRYEPYVVLRWCPGRTPLYDERFHGYGKNKIQYITHLRYLGYSFSVLPEAFIFHFPHNESPVKKIWNDLDSNNLHVQMDQLYGDFIREMKEMYEKPKISICDRSAYINK